MRGALNGARAARSIIRAEQWTPGEIIVNRIDVPIGAGAPPGDYELRVGWFSPETNQRLNVVAPDGGFGGTVARLSPIPIDQVTTDAITVEHRHAPRSGSHAGPEIVRLHAGNQ